MEIFSNIKGFAWDKGNINKNLEKHQVSNAECEEVFFNAPLVVVPDEAHSQVEDRYYTLGRTDAERLLFLVFTMRGEQIRVISARDMNKKEREVYHAQIKKNTGVQK